MIILPRLYPILDAGCFPDPRGLIAAAEGLIAAGCTVLQYRNKSGNARVMLEQARELRRLSRAGVPAPHLSVPHLRLIMNDRADLCLAAEFDGVHVGQEDLSPEAVRGIIGAERLLGVSTHNPDQLREADLTSADYLAIGPVFATSSKENPDPVVGLEGVRRARALTRKALVAIGGITRENAASVIEAGADSVAGISRPARGTAQTYQRVFFRFRGQ